MIFIRTQLYKELFIQRAQIVIILEIIMLRLLLFVMESISEVQVSFGLLLPLVRVL